MIKLKDILLKEIETGEKIPLGDGYVLERFGLYGNFFKVINPSRKTVLSCYVILNDDHGQKLKIPWVSEVTAFERGKGLYRRILPILKTTFGSIRSDTRGSISDEAEKAWKGVGARNVLRTDDTSIYGGSWYVLEK